MGHERNDHDRWFKEILSNFFEEFILAFFPTLYEEIDFSEMTFLSEELFTDIKKGEKRRVDLLIETKLKGQDVAIIIHTESQAYYQENFSERMFIYFSRLYEKYRKPIIPIAVYSYNEIKDEPNTFQVTIPSHHIMTFQFLTLELNKQNWREYLREENPVTAALLCKMNYKKSEQQELKREFLRLLLQLEKRYGKARMRLVSGFFESYISVNYEEDIEFLTHKERVKVMELMTSWERRGYEKGIEKGKQYGIEIGVEAVANNMLKKGMSVEDISELTGMSAEAIGKLVDKNIRE